MATVFGCAYKVSRQGGEIDELSNVRPAAIRRLAIVARGELWNGICADA